MATIQGDFNQATAAGRAKNALKQAGIADTRIRTWNILAGNGPSHSGGSSVATGAITGGIVAGGPGFLAGAGVGAILSGGDDGPHLPDASGVCVVVDIEGDEQQIEAILRDSGASNIHNGPVAR